MQSMTNSLCVYVAVRLNTGCFVSAEVGQSPRERQNTQSIRSTMAKQTIKAWEYTQWQTLSVYILQSY